MPTYGYHCPSCAAEFELLQRMSDPPQAACPTCGGAGRRLFYPAGILFKGSGFYKTDSRGSETAKPNGEAPAAAATKSSSGEAGSGGSEKSDTSAGSDRSAKPQTTVSPRAEPVTKPAARPPSPPPSTASGA